MLQVNNFVFSTIYDYYESIIDVTNILKKLHHVETIIKPTCHKKERDKKFLRKICKKSNENKLNDRTILKWRDSKYNLFLE